MSQTRIFWVRPLSKNRFSITCKEPTDGMKKVFNYFPVTTDMGLAYAMEKLGNRIDINEPELPAHLRGTFNGN